MIYLDNASTTRIDPAVLDAMMLYLTAEYGNAGTLYQLGRKSAEAIANARQQVASLIGASPDQLVFTSGGSEANNMVFYGAKNYLQSLEKTHIVTTQIEHDSVLNAVKNLCASQLSQDGSCLNPVFSASYVQPRENSCVYYQDVVEQIIPDKTGIVSVMHTNNETGLRNRGIRPLGKYCKSHGILFHTDCVQALYSGELNVENMGCDFLSISSHKIHGPKGVGALYVRNKEVVQPIIFGGNSQEFGLRGGTENVAGIVGFGAACEILQASRERDMEHITELRRLLYSGIVKYLSEYKLESIVHINGDVDLQEPGKTLNMRFDNVDGETLLLMLDSIGVCVSAGSACRSHESEPSHVLISMGVGCEDARNSLRFSLSRMNTKEEVKQAARIVADCVAFLHS